MDLLNGIAVVIDDAIKEQSKDPIIKIIEEINNKGIPTTCFVSLDQAQKCIANLLAVNFIILDWNVPPDIPAGVSPGSVIGAAQTIAFIKELKAVCFAPIFIITNEDEGDITSSIIPGLKTAGLYFDDEVKNFIHIKNKRKILQSNSLFQDIDSWLNKAPSIYLLKIWEKELLAAKNEIFWDLYDRSQGCWPQILWNHYKKEGENPQEAINNTIFQLIMNKMTLEGIDENKIIVEECNPNLDEMKKILERTMYQTDGLHGIKPGDIFKKDRKYYLNIRPECDTVQARDNWDTIYTITGKKLANRELRILRNNQYNKSGLVPKAYESFVLLLDGNNVVRFDFRKVESTKFSEMENVRLCRLLPPFITGIQQRFSSYLGRIGIPRLPIEIEENLLQISTSSQQGTQAPTQ